ncbi:hypothetical protein LCGC14_0885750 [marine sediment metagenome]|uniref:Uncharacterized protein n=1 Tax=marine sediment metagenome TaxID=412755 RepID=A0A0F9S7P0_9ZZZZ
MINLRNLTEKQQKQIAIGGGIGVGALVGLAIISRYMPKGFGEWVTTPRPPITKEYINITRPSRGRGSIIEGGRASQFSPPNVQAVRIRQRKEQSAKREHRQAIAATRMKRRKRL